MKASPSHTPFKVLLCISFLLMLLSGCGGGGSGGNTSSPDNNATPSESSPPTNQPPPDNAGNSTGTTLSEITLEELAYTEDQDPPPRDDVNVQVQDLDTEDRLVVATRISNGYKTHVVAASGMSEATAATDQFRVIEVNENSLVLTGNTDDIQAGDIIVGVADDSSNSPVLRRVITAPDGVTVVASDGTVQTEPASLDDAFPTTNLSITLEAYNVENSSNLPAGLTLVDSNMRLLQFDRQIAHQFLPGLTTTGRFSMSSNFHLKLDLGWGGINEARVVLSANPRAVARVDVNLPAAAIARTWSKEFNPIFDRTKTIFIYGIPVPLNLKVTPELAAKAEIGGALQATFGLDVRARASGGFAYAEDGFTLVQNFTPTLRRIGPTYEAEAGALVRGEANMRVMLSVFETSFKIPFYGRVVIDGPGVGTSVGPFAQFKVTASTGSEGPTTCAADLSVGLHADLIADLGPVARLIDADNIAATIGGITISNGGQELSTTLYETSMSLWAESFDCGTEPGSLGGHVADAREGTSLPGVQVTARNSDGDTLAVATNSGGNYLFDELAPGPYEVIFTKSGYEPAMARVTVEEGQATVLNQTLLMEEQEEGATGTLIVTVKNARTGTVLSGARVAVRQGLENRAGSVVEVGTTGADGTVALTVPAGYYTVQAAMEGFATGFASATARSNEASPPPGGGQAQVILSPEDEIAGEARIVLTWGQDPRDLDSHLFGPDGLHIAYYSMTSGNSSLDVDDVTSFGPETVTINGVDPNATYQYWVHHYDGEGSIATSGAQVTVYYGGLTYVFSPPAGAVSTWWHVFNIENGVVRGCTSACFASGGSRELPIATAVSTAAGSEWTAPPVTDLPPKN